MSLGDAHCEAITDLVDTSTAKKARKMANLITSPLRGRSHAGEGDREDEAMLLIPPFEERPLEALWRAVELVGFRVELSRELAKLFLGEQIEGFATCCPAPGSKSAEVVGGHRSAPKRHSGRSGKLRKWMVNCLQPNIWVFCPARRSCMTK